MWSKIKNILIFVVLGGILVAGYVVFMQKPKEAALVSNTTPITNTEGATPNSESSQLNQDFLGLLFSVKSINLDATVLETESFNSLKDSSIILIPDGTEGRPNPFAPIGTDNTLTSQQAADYLLSNTPTPQNQTDLVSPNTNTSNPSTTPATAPKNKN